MATSTDVDTERETMVHRLFEAIDSRDVDALVAHFEPDAVQLMGNRPPVRGHDEIRAGNNAFLFSIAGLRHELTGLWESGGTVLIRLLVHYELLDGRTVTLPAMTAFTEGPSGLIDHYQVWFDVAPLFESS